MNKKTIIFDLDGTLAIIDRRRDHALKMGKNGKMNWNEFFNPAHIAFDEPNEPVIKMAQLFKQDGFKIVIFSGRNDRMFDRTKEWLEWNDVPYDLLVMRPDKYQKDDFPVAAGNPAVSNWRFAPDDPGHRGSCTNLQEAHLNLSEHADYYQLPPEAPPFYHLLQ